jgi:PAS domain S-box-containing protein
MSVQRESSEWSVFREADFPAILIDADGNILNINARAIEIFRLSDLSGDLTLSGLHGLKGSHTKAIAEAIRQGSPGTRFQFEIDLLPAAARLVEVMVLSVYSSGHRILIFNDLSELKSTRDQLNLSENRFRELINNSSLGLLEVDVNEMILYANDSFCRLTGYGMDEIVGKHAPTLLIHDESNESESMLEEVREKRRTGISDAYELQIRGKHGQTIWVLISGAPVFDNSGNMTGSMGIHHDITLQKKEAEIRNKLLKDLDERNEVLEKQKQHLSIIYEFAAALLTLDSTSEIFKLIYKTLPGRLGFTDCIVYHYNEMRDRLEWDAGFTNLSDPFPEDFDPEIAVPTGSGITGVALAMRKPLWIKDTAQDNRYIHDRLFHNGPDGLPVFGSGKINARRSEIAVPVIYNDEILGLIDAGNTEADYFDQLHLETLITLSNLTAIRMVTIHQRNALIESERRLRQVIDSSLDAVYTIDQQFIVTEMNSRAEKLFEVSSDATIGKSFGNIFNPVFFDSLKEKMRALSDGDLKIQLETDCLKKDGTVFTAELVISKISIRGLLYYSAFIRDITIAKRAEAELISALNREAELNSLKTKFITLTSHEFRTPLTTIQSSTELLELTLKTLQIPQPEKFNRYLSRIYGEIGRLTSLMNDILVIGRIEAGRIKLKSQKSDLVQFIFTLVEGGDLIASDRRKIQVKISGDPVPVDFDPALLMHVFQNLLTNALKYSVGKPAPEITLEFLNDRCRIKITDFGIGIPEKEHNELFNTFFRASNAEHIQGTGLGLTIVKQFLELHGTAISVQSTENKGSTFSFDLYLNLS